MREKITSKLVVKLLVASALVGSSTIAMAEEAAPAVVETAAPSIPDKFVSDGSRLVLQGQDIAITPPAGWEILTRAAGMTLVMQEPKIEEAVKNYDKPKYQRNITIATMQRPSPIDEQRANALKEELTKNFGKPGLASNFQIIEHKFFDYRGKQDGLVVYSSMQLGEFPMMQMHVLVSGDERHYLMTYTDLATEFAANNAAYEHAWNSMVSLEVAGKAPIRYMEYVPYATAAGVLFLVFSMMGFVRRRLASRSYASDANEIYADDSMVAGRGDSDDGLTVSGIWCLDADQDIMHHSQPVRGRAVSKHSSISFASSYS